VHRTGARVTLCTFIALHVLVLVLVLLRTNTNTNTNTNTDTNTNKQHLLCVQSNLLIGTPVAWVSLLR
jgi:hypothetical protein